MGRLILILFSLIDLLNGQALTQMSLGECCRNGQKHGHQKHDCSGLPIISELNVCRIAQEQCCIAVLQKISCALGLHTAKEQGSCDRLALGPSCETEHAKVCCHCCLLGREALALGLGCDLNLTVAYGCGQVSHACCLEGLTDGVTNSTRAPTSENRLANDVEETQPKDTCRGAGKCSHHCLGNDTCGCFRGYKLKPDGHNCEDINECLLGAHHCRLGERCINTVGSYRCQREVSCGTGYELTDNNNCEDIDECEIGTHNCGVEFICHNTQGSFRCQPRNVCELGFIQDALGNCIDMNECLIQRSPCQPGQTCVNTVGSFFCQRNSPSCGQGYHLNEEGTRCVDIDECLGTDNACAGHGCVNTVGSFRCDCHRGYVFNSISRTCEDINECRHYPGRLCAHKCDNILGSYQCSCTMGFKLASDGRNCEDMNECESSPCSQQCANVYGSYQCYCRRGYQLSDVDGTTCEDIDECSLHSGGHVCSHRCHNTDGSFYCSCPSPGYTLTPSGHSCQDVDECLTGTHNCSETEHCFNIHGGFRCLSLECPANYRRVGDTPLRCGKSCQPGDVACLSDPVQSISHTVISLPTFRKITRPEEIVFLRTGPPGQSSYWTGSLSIVFDILEGNVQNAFDIIKRHERGASVGVIRQVKPISGPLHTVLKLAINYVTSGVVSHRSLINVHIYVSEFPF